MMHIIAFLCIEVNAEFIFVVRFRDWRRVGGGKGYKMSIKKKLFTAAFALLIVSVVALAAALGVVYHKVKAFDKKHGSDVLANLSPKELFDKTNTVKKAAASVRTVNSSTEEAPAREEDPQNAEMSPP